VLIRGAGLAESKIRSLVERIAAQPNIAPRPRTEVVGLPGDSMLERIHPMRVLVARIGAR